MSEATRLFDSDEDLDLTDTKLHASDEDDDDDDELIKYIDLPGKVTSSDGKYIESFEFKPLTSPSTKAKEKTKVTHKNAPIVLLSDTESDVEEVEVKRETSFLSEPPDYESPEEDERTDVKRAGFGDVNKDSSGEMGYKELLELCGQDVGDDDHEMEYDDNYHHVDDSDDETYYSGTTKIKTKTHLKRKSPYSVKDRSKPVKGKGKRPVSGMRKFKSSSQGRKSPESTGTDQNLVVVDSARPICFGDRPVDLNAPIVEEISVIPPPPLMCEACEKETSHNSMVQCCDGHLDCMRCVEASAKKVLVGEKKGSVECPQSDCTSSVPLSELRKALPAIVLDLLEDKWNRETMEALENMKDAVKCPGCNYSAVLDMAVKRFQCLQCNEAFCRYCDRKWTERKTHDLCIRTKQWTSTVTGNVVNIPAQWSDPDTDSVDGRSKSHTIVELDKSSAEFCDVVHFMNKDMSSNVKKIFRIQNERLWEKYSLSRSHMVADLGELNINEKRLFHGTHSDVIEAICKEGFDWRLCGKHGTVYGQGTYFAKSPWLSHQYSSGNSSRRGRPNIGGSGFYFSKPTGPSTQYKPPLRFGGSSNWYITV
ncbi:uncharacterized protein LOC132758164, partial [Ruditapes philippinarum]|uniref:uncharacterized protein LOC132758164 n=1 Tax=Ruditapes philippinarum TaxID=129788 RepID=UPI00295BF38E